MVPYQRHWRMWDDVPLSSNLQYKIEMTEASKLLDGTGWANGSYIGGSDVLIDWLLDCRIGHEETFASELELPTIFSLGGSIA